MHAATGRKDFSAENLEECGETQSPAAEDVAQVVAYATAAECTEAVLAQHEGRIRRCERFEFVDDLGVPCSGHACHLAALGGVRSELLLRAAGIHGKMLLH